MSDDVAGNVREAFQGKRGKILIVGGGLAIAGYVWWTRRTGTPEPVPGDELGDATPVAGGGGRTPQTAPPVGNDSTGSTTPQRPTSNAAWISQGVDFLVGRAVSGSAAYSALNKALDGAQLTTQETAWVSQVIGALGSPPDGMPPLSSAPPTPPAGGTPPPGTGGDGSRPAGAHIHHVTTTGTTATVGWNAAKGSTSYIAYRSNAPGPVLSRTGITGTSYTWTGLAPGHSYAFSVAGVNKAGRGALSNVITVKTKK